MFKKIAALAVASVGLLAFASSQSNAAIVYMNISDVHPPIAGIAGFDGTKIVSLGGLDDFVVSDPSIPNTTTFAGASFRIDSGFVLGATSVIDSDGSNSVNDGDTVAATIGAGSFSIIDNIGGVLVSGSFNSAKMTTSIGSTAATINTANVNGLDLVAGPALKAVLGNIDLQPSESFALNIVGIAGPGVRTTSSTLVFAGPPTAIYTATLAPFAIGQIPPTSGAVNMTANLVFVPEPASLSLLGMGALGLIARRRRA